MFISYRLKHDVQTAWFIVLGSRLQLVTTGVRSPFPSAYRDSTFLRIFSVASNAVLWITSSLSFIPIRFKTDIAAGVSSSLSFTVSTHPGWQHQL